MVAWSSEMPGLTKALAESSTLKSLTLQTHQSRWMTRGIESLFAAMKAYRSEISAAVSCLAPWVNSLSLSFDYAKFRLISHPPVTVVSIARQTKKSTFWTKFCIFLSLSLCLFTQQLSFFFFSVFQKLEFFISWLKILMRVCFFTQQSKSINDNHEFQHEKRPCFFFSRWVSVLEFFNQ